MTSTYSILPTYSVAGWRPPPAALEALRGLSGQAAAAPPPDDPDRLRRQLLTLLRGPGPDTRLGRELVKLLEGLR